MSVCNVVKFSFLALASLVATCACADVQTSIEQDSVQSGALDGQRYRVIVSTDIGGTDPGERRPRKRA